MIKDFLCKCNHRLYYHMAIGQNKNIMCWQCQCNEFIADNLRYLEYCYEKI